MELDDCATGTEALGTSRDRRDVRKTVPNIRVCMGVAGSFTVFATSSQAAGGPNSQLIVR